VTAIADSIGFQLPQDAAARAAWIRSPGRWDSLLVEPFLARVRTRFGIAAEADPPLRARIGRALAARAAQVRWGDDAEDELRLATDPDVALALEQFPRLAELLGQP
jgi:hypothetical protein